MAHLCSFRILAGIFVFLLGAILLGAKPAEAQGTGLEAEYFDEKNLSGESVTRTAVTPTGTSDGDDGAAPKLKVRAARRQPVRGSGAVRLRGRVSERASLAASGWLSAGGINRALKTRRSVNARARRWKRLTVRLTAAHRRQVVEAAAAA